MISIATDGQVACAARPFRYRGKLQLGVVVKATFTLTPNGVVANAAPVDVVAADRTFDGNPSRSVEFASDLAPYRPRCDVTLVGHAHAVAGAALPAASVRLGIARDGQPLLDKIVNVFGDRRGGGAPEPWVKMPLVYERALGGPGEANPVGTEAPNLVDPVDPRRVAGFGPISPFWPARKRLLGKLERRALDEPIAALPDDIAWGYFQAAPLDQQIAYPVGGEWLVLDGVDPVHARLSTQLPALRGAARVFSGVGGAPQAVELVCDAIAIDGARSRVTLTWRGRQEIASEPALASTRVAAALEAKGATIAWAALDVHATAPQRAPAEAPGEGTMVASEAEVERVARKPAVPFAGSSARPEPPPPPSRSGTPFAPARHVAGDDAGGRGVLGAPHHHEVSPREPPAAGEETMALRPEHHAALGARAAAPFTASSSASPPSARVSPPSSGTPWSIATPTTTPTSAPGEQTEAALHALAPAASAPVRAAAAAAAPPAAVAANASAHPLADAIRRAGAREDEIDVLLRAIDEPPA